MRPLLEDRLNDAIPEEYRNSITLNVVMNKTTDHIYFKDLKSGFLWISESQAERFGLKDSSESVGKTDFNYFSEEHAKKARQDEIKIIETGKTIECFEEKETWPNGTETWVSTTKMPLYGEGGKIMGTWGISRDITAQKNAEHEKNSLREKLFQAQKMEAIGRMAARFYHDVNNYLTPPLICIEFAIKEAEQGRSLSAATIDELRQALLSNERLRDLVKSYSDFTRQEEYTLKPADLNSIIRATESKLTKISDANQSNIYSLISKLEATQHIDADENHLPRVLDNLVSNARDAMPNGGTITISTADRYLERQIVIRYDILEPGSYVVLSVADTGTGIQPQVLERMFKDIHTTKPMGKGTGLGLLSVASIVKGHKAYINVITELGKGTTFEIYFPAKQN